MKYEITALTPEINRLQVRYTNNENREVFLAFVTESFLEEDLHAMAQEGIARAFTYFKNTEESVDVSITPESLENKTVETTITDYVPTDPPEYDAFNQYLKKGMVENNGVLTDSWQILSLNQEQKDQVTINWRSGATATMRQARLALKQQGLLATVQSNMDALPEEAQIEWEYAAQVERGSDLVATLGAALGLTEDQLDDLFKLAVTL